MDERLLQHYLGNVPLNTDDHPYIEFSTPKNMWKVRDYGMQNIRELVSYNGEILPYLKLKGIDVKEVGNFPENLEDYTDGRKIYIQGAVMEKNGMVREATVYYRHARSKVGNEYLNWLTSRKLGIIYRGQGKLVKALNEFKRAINIRPDDTRVRLWLADIYIRINQWNLAMDQIRETIRLNPENAIACGMAGYLFMQQGKINEARIALEKAMEIYPYDERTNSMYRQILSLYH